nr:E3 ubiquitin-protein ligase TRIM21 [Nothobranchius furzeri]
MSASSSRRSDDQFLCSICLDVFTDPVTTPCGHNFCKTCISQHWDCDTSCQCPVCRKVFQMRPELEVNTLLREMVHQCRVETSSSSEEQADNIQQMIQNRRLKIQEIKESVEISKDAADREKAEGVQVFTDLLESVQRSLNELIDEIEEKQKTTEEQAEDLVSDLEQEISELMNRSSEENQLSWSKDLTAVRVLPSSYEETVVTVLDQLQEKLEGKIRTQLEPKKKNLLQAELKAMQQFAVDVTLDPDTAHPYLVLSDDEKQVYCGDVWRNLPDGPERFSNCYGVLGKPSFSSGRFYFEVQVEGKTEWGLGVARSSIGRMGEVTMSPENGCWSAWLINGTHYVGGTDPPEDLYLQSVPEKVGVFVDYEEGLVAIYDVEAPARICSFNNSCFSEELYPFFCPCDSHGGENSAPLIICPVDPSESVC